MKESTVNDCTLIELPQYFSPNGRITSINNSIEVPFEIKRVYYLYDIPGGEDRGGHAHKELQQLIVAASGSFDLMIDDSREKKIYSLNRPYLGVILPPGLWRELGNFSSGSICLVMASKKYDELDYIRSYEKFIEYKI
jgi:hypothetical protein